MLKPVLFTAILLFLFGTVQLSAQSQNTGNSSKTDLKFLEDISSEASLIPAQIDISTKANLIKGDAQFASRKVTNNLGGNLVEKAVALQFKYSLLLDIEVELVKNFNLFKIIDEWYGTRYRMGGISKSGIDCSALMQVFFTALYGISLPRTAREQFQFSQKISRTEIREGDLVFFNTRGGVSHVGMYLANNKFVHASSSGGVMISDLYDSYYSSKFIGVGRVGETPSEASELLTP